ncbi:hypothetical protein NC653_024243 [Populus alba x Populus x berolinensis]|uniref:Uncharacterized protein n=1 Tax=Populus alba x Populus x berolinensis TaxID=444605 RepID=A0AAD6M894_9ROSI|nr:hypothetical protein NC653_024243 [Populus alba x Populus x berolinensis]
MPPPFQVLCHVLLKKIVHVIDDSMQDVVVAAGGEPPIGRKQYMTCSRAIATANIGQHAKIYGEGSGFAKLWSMQAIGFRVNMRV